jgi:hypothetical protein
MATTSSSIKETLSFWQPRTTRILTEEDAREIDRNLTAYFELLLEWSTGERSPVEGAA